MSNIERGKYTPTTSFIFEICNALGETPDYYLIGNPSKNTDEITKIIKVLPESKQKILLKLIECYINETSRL